MSLLSSGFVRQKLYVDFSSVKIACPKGIYVAPIPDDSSRWTGVMFVRKGPYANAILRFQIAFPDHFPARPPVLTFQSDVFHPLVTPLTTYTYSTRDSGAETVSAADEQRLPPGGLSLRHGFPEWFPPTGSTTAPVVPPARGAPTDPAEDRGARGEEGEASASSPSSPVPPLSPRPFSPGAAPPRTSVVRPPPHVVEVLQYLRVIFDTESVLDTVPLEAAANQGAWHAWRSYRVKSPVVRPTFGTRLPPTPSRSSAGDRNESGGDRSASPLQQPGGARRPGEWNWQGVWEDRVRKSVQASTSDPVLFGGEVGDVVASHISVHARNSITDVWQIDFLKLDPELLAEISPFNQPQAEPISSP